MAGVGFDAAMISEADGGLKERLGRAAYIWTGSKSLRAQPFRAKITVDGSDWYDGKASCILIGNVSRLLGGIQLFEDAHPDDGRLEVGVVNAEGVIQWGGTFARTAFGHAGRSRFVQETKARSVKVKLSRKVIYQLDGGARAKVKSFKARVEPKAVTVCVPRTFPH